MIYGTHNSATGGKLVWWLRPIGGIINLTSKCQDRTIAQQLADGVKVFNLQVAKVNGKWRFTHGLAVYEEDVFDTLKLMRLGASVKEPIYFQLYLDKCFWCKQDIEEFKELVKKVDAEICNTYFVMQYAWVEGTDVYLRTSDAHIDLSEKYWVLKSANSWIDHLPLPRFQARRNNAQYKSECKNKYLMLDFYERG